MRLPLCVGLALAAVTFSSGASATSTVPLALTIKGAGTVKISGKPAVSCKATCRVTVQVAAVAKIAVAFTPGKLWKLAPVKGACKGSAPKCSFTATRAASLSVTFLAPGVRANPIPLNTAWRLAGNWTLKVDSANPNAQLSNPNGTPMAPPVGAQYFMTYIEATYTGGGSAPIGNFADGLMVAGSHGATYGLGGIGCGPGYGELPSPDLQVKIENNEPVYSGQSAAGNICYQIASNDAASLLLDYHTYPGTPQDTWFALR